MAAVTSNRARALRLMIAGAAGFFTYTVLFFWSGPRVLPIVPRAIAEPALQTLGVAAVLAFALGLVMLVAAFIRRSTSN
jgi:hypothetical protein